MHTVKHNTEIPILHPDAPLIEHDNFIPCGPGDRLRIAGEGYSTLSRDGAAAVVRQANLQHELSIAKVENSELQTYRYTDALTGISNNEAFNLALAESLERADRGEVPHPAVLFIDLDRFKEANDTRGHDEGDRILSEIASEFAKIINLRSDMTPEGVELLEMIARKSGDEFVAFIYPINYQNENGRRDTTKSAEEIISGFTERIEKLVAEVATRHGAPFVGVSVGHVIHKPGESLERVRQRSDVDMYRVKNSKKSGRIKQLLGRIFNNSTR